MCMYGFYMSIVCVVCVLCVCTVSGVEQEPNRLPSRGSSMRDGPEEKEVGSEKREMEAWAIQMARQVG